MRYIIGALLLAVLLPGALLAEPAAEEKKLKDWAFSFTPYFWLSNFRTDVDGEVIRGNVDQTAKLTDSAFMFIGSASWKRWSVGVDGLFSDIGTAQALGPVDLEIKVHQEIVTPRVGFKILDSRRVDRDGGVGLWANLGARHWITRPTITYTWHPIIGNDPPTTGIIAIDDSWWDPLVGAGAHFKVTRVVHFMARGNVGGFGLGEASDFTWDLGAYASFRVWRYAAIHAGYQVIDYKRTAGEGDDTTTTKQHMSGIFIGVSFFY